MRKSLKLYLTALLVGTFSFVVACDKTSLPTTPTLPPVVATVVPTVDAQASFSALSSASQSFLLSTNITPYKRVTRWQGGAVINVYADPGFTEQDRTTATHFWEVVTKFDAIKQTGVSFQFVDRPVSQITLDLEFPIVGAADACGAAAPTVGGGGLIIAGFAKLAVGLTPPCPASYAAVTLTHELGHILGIGHTPKETDVMSAPGVSVTASPLLQESMAWLYSAPPGVVVK